MSKAKIVVSAFDGLAGGRIALERAGVLIDKYFASEIDKYAMKVAKHNYPDIVHIGDVTNVKGSDLPEIDLLMGGSPCQGFSFAGKQLNFDDPRSKLFFEFVRLNDELKPKYFLLENVKMKKEYQDVISSYLGVEPILINSALVSAQNRNRLYWTNIPNVTQPADKGIFLKDIVDGDYIVDREKSLCVRAGGGITGDAAKRRYFERSYGQFKFTPNPDNSCTLENIVSMSMLELERLQTLPDNYTASVSDAQRYKMIGNGWTVDVIAHILGGMK
jgi:site-specific DNA-cytosine methylase